MYGGSDSSREDEMSHQRGWGIGEDFCPGNPRSAQQHHLLTPGERNVALLAAEAMS